MPRYHFNLYNRIGSVEDEEGRELDEIEAARSAAIREARALIAAEVMEGRLDLHGRIEVLDGKGALLLTVRFDEAVTKTELSLRMEARPDPPPG